MRKRDISITKSLLNVLQKDIETFWIEEKIKNSVKKFNSDVIDHLRETDFDWNFIDYSWQALSRFESRRGSSRSWVSSKSWEFFKSRERSIEERPLQITSRVINNKEFSETITLFSLIRKFSQSFTLIRNIRRSKLLSISIRKFIQWLTSIRKRISSQTIISIIFISIFEVLSVLSIIERIL
jgi:hypothetical protein